MSTTPPMPGKPEPIPPKNPPPQPCDDEVPAKEEAPKE